MRLQLNPLVYLTVHVNRKVWHNHERTANIHELQLRREWMLPTQGNRSRNGQRTIHPCIPNEPSVYLNIQLPISMLPDDGIGLYAQTWEIRMRTGNAQGGFPYIFPNRNKDCSRMIERKTVYLSLMHSFFLKQRDGA